MHSGYILRNRYTIDRPLASGYFGDTYLALDCDYYRPKYVVVKHLKPQNQDPNLLQVARRLFETEAKVLSILGEKTDRIPTLYAYFEEQNEFYLVQEFIEGITLARELANGKLSTAQTIHVLREILIGLSVVHAEKTIHRDLKPDNIIRRASDGALVLIDFGAVKEVGQVTLTSPNPKTIASIGFGTEGYMPSEQAMGFPKLASDIYAVGAIGIECLTGREPHLLFDRDRLEFNWRHLYQASDPKIDPLISRLAMVLNKMLQPRHLDRYANASEALAAFDRLMNISIPIPTPTVRRSLPSHRNLSTSMDRAAFLKLLGLGGLGTAISLAVPQIMQHSESQSTIISRIESGSMAQPATLRLVSVKLNESGDVIDRPAIEIQTFQEDLGGGVFLPMVKIPAGSFNMGAAEAESGRQPPEHPQHSVKIPEFYLAQTLITQAQWAAVFPDKEIGSRGKPQLPVHSINWLDAIAFCKLLSQKTGRKYRLPSEAEWEYACRSNSTAPFAYGDTIVSSIVNCNGEQPYAQAPKGGWRQAATPVATFPPNRFGLYDMHGNLWEWCLDEWFDSYRNAPTDGSPRGNMQARDGLQSRVVRGGSWFSYPNSCRAANRAGLFASFRHEHYGFRVACLCDDRSS